MATFAWPTVTAVSQHGLPPITQSEGLSNYGLWWYIIELSITDDDLYKCILEESKPIPEGEPLTPEMNKDLRCILTTMIYPHCVIHVQNAITSKQACDSLKQVYSDCGPNSRLGLLTQLLDAILINYLTDAYVADCVNISQLLAETWSKCDH